jgi:hypothetical protein
MAAAGANRKKLILKKGATEFLGSHLLKNGIQVSIFL